MPGAPSTAYTTKKLPVHIPGVVKYDSYLALKLSAYGSSIKSLFYLDLLLIGADGFLGAIEDNPTSLNYQMHNPARFSKIRIKGSDGKKYIVLNDAGLNTLGYAPGVAWESLEIGNIQVKSSFYSAYYVDTDSHGFKWRIGTSGAFDTGNKGILTAGVNSLNSAYLIGDGGGSFRAGQTIFAKSFIANAEGYWEEALLEGLILPRAVSLKYSSAYASSACGSTNNTYYSDQGTMDYGTTLYTGTDMLTPVADGYYSDGSMWYRHEYDVFADRKCVTDKGICANGGYPSGDPGNTAPYVIWDWAEYSNMDASTACGMSGSYQNPRTTYQANSDGKHYTNSSLNVLCDDGWYTRMGDSAIYEWVYIVSGVEQSTGSC